MHQLDHVVVAAPDLAAAKTGFAEETGVIPVDGGAHPGLGTRNALVSFGDDHYLEIIAPDPGQNPTGTFAEHLAALASPTLFHWAIRVTDLQAVRRHAETVGFEPGAILPTQRQVPSGELLSWELMGIGGHSLGGLVPFYINWKDTPHPATTSPVVGALKELTLSTPPESALADLLNPLPRGVTLREGPGAMKVSFDSPNGTVTYTTGNELPLGFRL